jgi:hypothetical protein
MYYVSFWVVCNCFFFSGSSLFLLMAFPLFSFLLNLIFESVNKYCKFVHHNGQIKYFFDLLFLYLFFSVFQIFLCSRTKTTGCPPPVRVGKSHRPEKLGYTPPQCLGDFSWCHQVASREKNSARIYGYVAACGGGYERWGGQQRVRPAALPSPGLGSRRRLHAQLGRCR